MDLSLLTCNASLGLRIQIPPLFHVELAKDCWESVDMVWFQSAQNIGLSNSKLKTALKYTVGSQCTPVPDRWTDRHVGQTDG